MALLFMLVALPRPDAIAVFNRALVISRLDQFFTEGGDPVVMTPEQVKRLRAAMARFDANHDGRLDPDERAALLRFLKILP